MGPDQTATRGGHGSTSLDDLQLYAAILEGLLADLETFLAGFHLGFFHGVHLQKFAQLLLITPVTLKIVVMDGASLRVDDDGVLPARQMNEQPSSFPAEELSGPCGRHG